MLTRSPVTLTGSSNVAEIRRSHQVPADRRVQAVRQEPRLEADAGGVPPRHPSKLHIPIRNIHSVTKITEPWPQGIHYFWFLSS